MADKNPNVLYEDIKALTGNLEAIVDLVEELNEKAKETMNDANDFGGVIAKVFKEQLAKYFIPEVQKMVEPVNNLIAGDRIPGSLKDLTVFLDSVPLAMIRQEPSVAELASPVVPGNTNLNVPVQGNNPVDQLPQNASYANGTVQESRKVKESKIFRTGEEYADYITNRSDWEEYMDKGLDVLMTDAFLAGGGSYGKALDYVQSDAYFDIDNYEQAIIDAFNAGKKSRAIRESRKLRKHMREDALPHTSYEVKYHYVGDFFTDEEKEEKTIIVKGFDPEDAKKNAQRLVGEKAEVTTVTEYDEKTPMDKDIPVDAREQANQASKAAKNDKGEEKSVAKDEEPKDEKEEDDKDSEKITESYTKYVVVRTSTVGSALGEDTANIEPQVVAEFDNEEEANQRRDDLNANAVFPEEKEKLGTEYKVEKLEVNLDDLQA